MPICYALQPFEILGYVPGAFYFEADTGLLERQIYFEHLSDFVDSAELAFHENTFKIMRKLDKKWIAEQLRVSLDALNQTLTNPSRKKEVQFFLEKRINYLKDYLDEIIKHQQPFGLQLNRDDFVSSKKCKIPDQVFLVAQFEKLGQSIRYQLQLELDEKPFPLLGKQLEIILNEHGYCVLSGNLIRLNGAKASLLKPFINKNEVLIQEKYFDEYLEKFIAPLAEMGSIEIKCIGLNTELIDRPTKSIIMIERHLTEKKWVGYFEHQYENVSIYPWTRKSRFSKIINQENKKVIQQITRSQESENAVEVVFSQLEKTDSGHFILPIQDIENLPEWIADLQKNLPTNVEIGKMWFEGRSVYIGRKSFTVVPSQNTRDWFDLEIDIQVGPFNISFSKIADALKNNLPAILLPDNSFFIIPEVWKAKIRRISQFITPEGKLSIVHKHILEESSIAISKRKLFNPISPEKFTYRPYQLEGLKTLLAAYSEQSGFLLADEMGLGKTLQVLGLVASLAAAECIHNRKPSLKLQTGMQLSLFDEPNIEYNQNDICAALIIVPNALLNNWLRESNRFFPHLTACIHIGADRAKSTTQLAGNHIVITSYNTMRQDINLLSQNHWPLIVLDEAQAVKNPDSLVSMALQRIKGDFKVALTGTPVENSIKDLWSIFNYLVPGLLGNLKDFKDDYLDPITKSQSKEALSDFGFLLKPYVLRRRKNLVARELPILDLQVVYNEMETEQEHLYETIKSQMRNSLLRISDESPENIFIHLFNALSQLRQIAIHPKMIGEPLESGKHTQLIDDIATIYSSDNKVLVFSSFVKHLNLISESLDKLGIPSTCYTGSMTKKGRQQVIDTFQEQSCAGVLLMSLKAGGTGLNLTAADFVLLADPWWNPMAEAQAIARVHRIGRDKPVTVKKYISRQTVEEKILGLQASKSEVANLIMEIAEEGPVPQNHTLSREDLLTLLD
jgi:superfamily II DNA or RNA helicase